MKKLFIMLAMATCLVANAKDVKVSSPDGRIAVNIKDDAGVLTYSTALDGRELFYSNRIALNLGNKYLGEPTKILGVKKASVNETITPVVPMKQSKIRNQYNQLLLTMKGGYKVEFRVFDNAVAYRFILNEKGKVKIENEEVSFKPSIPMDVHYQGTNSYITSSENMYKHCDVNEWKGTEGQKDMSTLPIVLSAKNEDLHLLFCESDLKDYPGMFMHGVDEDGFLYASHPKYPAKWELDGDRGSRFPELAPYIAETTGKRSLPWRYCVISDSKGILEQTLTAQLAGKCEIDDPSWIKPGQVSWDWWNHKELYGPDVDFKTGCNTKTYKYYIDFASKYGIPYIIMDEGWQKNTFAAFESNPELDLQECIRYGKEKGVKIILWLTWTCVDRNLDTLFKTYSEWGIAGTKIDFMDRQDQWMVNYYERVVKEAAKYHMLVDFHGAFKPAGLEQRYPNLLAYEGIRGLEQMDGCQPDNTLYIPFMRNAVGPADFTPGAMGNVQPEFLRYQWPNKLVAGTRAYHMALLTVLETGTQMLCDSPTQYYKNPDCTEFLSQIPCKWDETKALAAQFGEYLVVAKRSGNRWFVAGICNGKEKTRHLHLPLSFLGSGNYKMTAFVDGYHAGYQAMDYRKEESTVDKNGVLDITMVRNGGFTAIIEP